MGIELFVLALLIVLNAFFAASEIALISLNDNKVRKMAEQGDKKSIMLKNLLSEPSRFLATIQIGITLAGFLASAFAAESFAGRLAIWLHELGVPLSTRLLETISVIVITLILSYFTLVLGELVPKRLALQKADEISRLAVGPLTSLSKITSPFVKLLTLSTNVIVRLLGVNPNADNENVTEEEIRMMVDVGEESGAIQEIEKEMINNIFEFNNKLVSSVMTHRTDIVAIPATYNLKQTVQMINVEKYTRFPVYEDNIDNIIGILHAKDLLQFIEDKNEDSFSLKELIREPFMVFESRIIDHLFKDMQKNNIHLAIVIDEYGGTEGIVTIEDLLEEIVGNIFDEYDELEMSMNEVQKVGQDMYILPGKLALYEVEDILKVELPKSGYDTLSGFIIGQLGYIPAIGEKPKLEYNNVTLHVEEMDDRRILKVKIKLKERESNVHN